MVEQQTDFYVSLTMHVTKFNSMKTITFSFLIFFGLYLAVPVSGQTLKEIMTNQVSLPNGWKLSPVGKMLPLGDLPLNIAVHPSGKILAVTNNGQSVQSIQLIDPKNEDS